MKQRPFVIGLTGSIGMGKSTTAQFFADAGVPVWDADATVHTLYAPGGAAVQAVGAHYPEVIVGDTVDREKLRGLITKDPNILDHIQSLVHPLVASHRADFIDAHSDVVLLDIPLLYEVGADQDCDLVVVVSAPADIQRKRVLDRGEMTEAELDSILARQMPDAEKRARADHVIETVTIDGARAAVARILHSVRSRHA